MKKSSISKILKLLSGNLIFYLLIKDSVFDSNYYPLYDHQETCSLETSSKPWFLLRLWRQDTLKQRKQQSIQNIIISDDNVKVSRRWGTPQQPRPLSSGPAPGPGPGHGHHDGDADGDSPHSPRAHRILLQHLHRPSTRVDQTGQ